MMRPLFVYETGIELAAFWIFYYVENRSLTFTIYSIENKSLDRNRFSLII
jgi:hypothetical protein